MNQPARAGVAGVLDMLREMDEPSREKLLDNISKKDATFAEMLRAEIFTFSDLQHLSPNEARTLIQEFREEELALALRACDAAVKRFFLTNLSKRVAESIEDLISGGKPRRKSEVLEMQQAILNRAKDLQEKGKLKLKKASKDEYV